MTNFIWTAKDKYGSAVTREVLAQTSAESKTILLNQGFTDLELVQDEVAAAAIAGLPSKITVLGQTTEITAEQRLKYRNKPPLTFWSALGRGINQSKGLSVLIVVLAIYQAYRGHTTSAILVGGGLLAWLLFIIGVSLPSIYYTRLIKALDWQRWSEVLDLVQTLKTLGKISFIKIPATELAKNRAKALAGSGQLSEALKEFQPCENRPDCPSWLYKASLAGIYDAAKQHAKAIELTRQSLAEKPTPICYLDLANRLARYNHDPVRAHEALVEAEKSPLPEAVRPFRLRCIGIIAYLEGDRLTAQQNLEAALEIMERTRHQPFRDGHISVAKAYLCCVLAKQHNLVAAGKNFTEAQEYLVATGETQLLAECKRAMLHTG